MQRAYLCQVCDTGSPEPLVTEQCLLNNGHQTIDRISSDTTWVKSVIMSLISDHLNSLVFKIDVNTFAKLLTKLIPR
jgi:hypothetical protein